jgi:hypothetical protein
MLLDEMKGENRLAVFSAHSADVSVSAPSSVQAFSFSQALRLMIVLDRH